MGLGAVSAVSVSVSCECSFTRLYFVTARVFHEILSSQGATRHAFHERPLIFTSLESCFRRTEPLRTSSGCNLSPQSLALTGSSVIMATFSRQMLSRHKTTATYGGQEEGRESMLKVFPPRPNKMWETFHIVERCVEINQRIRLSLTSTPSS